MRSLQTQLSSLLVGEHDTTRSAEILQRILTILQGTAILLIPLVLVASSGPHALARLVALLTLALLVGVILRLLRSGHIQLTRTVTVLGVWAVITTSIVLGGGGIHSIGFPAYLILVIIAGLTLPRSTMFLAAFLAIGTGLAFALLGEEPLPAGGALSYTNLDAWLVQSLMLIVAAGLLSLAGITTDRALTSAKRGVAEQAMAAQTAMAKEQEFRALYATAESQARELLLRDQIRTAIAKELDLPALIRTVVESIARIFGYERVSLYLNERDAFVLQHQVGAEGIPHTVSTEDATAARLLSTAKPVLIGSAESRDQGSPRLVLPLMDAGQVVGMLNLEAPKGGRLSDEDVRRMTAVAEHVGVAFGQARLHEAVRQSEEQYRRLFEDAPVGIGVADETGNLLAFNDAILAPGGYSREEMEQIRTVDRLYYDAAERAEVLTALGRDGFVRRTRVKFRRKDGTPYDALLSLNRTELKGQRVVQAIVENISEQARAEQALRENEDQYRLVAETAMDGIIMLEDSGKIRLANPAAERIFGYSAEELAGRPLTELIPDIRMQQLVKAQGVAGGNGRSNPEHPGLAHVGRRKDGSSIPLEASFGLHAGDGQKYLIGVLRDVSERKKADQVLHETEQRFRLLVEQLPAVVFLERNDEKRTIEYISPRIQQLLGYTTEEWMEGRKLWEDSIHPDDRRRVVAVHGVGPRRRSTSSEEYRLRRKDGVFIWVREEAHAVAVEGGQPRFWQGILLDITDRKQAEQSLQRQLAELTVLHRLSAAVAAGISQDELIRETTDLIGSILDVDNYGVFLLNRAGDGLTPHPAYRGVDAGALKNDLPLSLGISGLVASSGRTVRVGDVANEPAYHAAVEGIRSELCVPILVSDQIVGVINLESRVADNFSAEDERLIATIAGGLGNAIGRLRLFEAERRRRREAETLRYAAAALNSSLDLASILEAILTFLRQVAPHESAGIFLEEGGSLRWAIAQGSEQAKARVGSRLSADNEIYQHVKRTSRPLVVGDVRNDSRFASWGIDESICSWMTVPLISRGVVIGGISLESKEANSYDARTGELAIALAHQAAIAMENARIFEDERRRTRIIEALAEIANEIDSTGEITPLLDKVAQRTLDLLRGSHTAIYLVQDDGVTVKVVTAKGSYSSELLSHTIRVGEGITGHIIASGRPEIVNDTTRDPRTIRVPGTPEEDGLRETVMSAPLILRGRQIGAINVWRSRTNGLFDDAELNFLISIAHQASISIELARLFQETSRRARESAAIAEVGRDISATLRLDRVLERITGYASDLLRADTSAVYLFDPRDGILRAKYAAGPDAEQIKRDPLTIGAGILGAIAASKVGEIVNDTVADPRAIIIKDTVVDPLEHVMAVPVVTKDQLTGLLAVWRTGAGLEFIPTELEFLTSLAHQAAIAIENARLFESEQRRRAEAETLQEASAVMATALDWEQALDLILDELARVLPYDSASVQLRRGDAVEIVGGRGWSRPESVLGQRFPIPGENPNSVVILERRALILKDAPGTYALFREEPHSHIRSWLGVPLISQNEVIGMLAVDSTQPDYFSEDQIRLVSGFAHQAAAAVENARLFTSLQRANLDLSWTYDSTLEGWGNALELRDKDTQGHTLRVTELTLKLAQRLGCGPDELGHIRRGALMHDIGKMGVSDKILNKPGPLTSREWAEMRRHPQYAYDMLYPISYLRPALEIPYSHHERWDGSGYPHGLKGPQIPLAARIFAVVDVWDALLSDRPYRKAWARRRVERFIKEHAGSQFDPAIVPVFLQMMTEEPGRPGR